MKQMKYKRLFVWRTLAIAILSGFVTAFACDGGGGAAASQNLAQDILGTWQNEMKTADSTIKQTLTFTPDGKIKGTADAEIATDFSGTYRVVDNQTVIINYDFLKNNPKSEEAGRMNVKFNGNTMIMVSPQFPDIQAAYRRL